MRNLHLWDDGVTLPVPQHTLESRQMEQHFQSIPQSQHQSCIILSRHKVPWTITDYKLLMCILTQQFWLLLFCSPQACSNWLPHRESNTATKYLIFKTFRPTRLDASSHRLSTATVLGMQSLSVNHSMVRKQLPFNAQKQISSNEKKRKIKTGTDDREWYATYITITIKSW